MFLKITKSILIVAVIGFVLTLIGCQSSNNVEKNIITEGAIDNIIDPSKEQDLQFETCTKLKEYVISNDKIDKSFYFVDLDSFFINPDFKKNILFKYLSEEDYNSSYIEILASIYDDELGEDDISNNLDGELKESYSLLLRAFPFVYKGGELNYKLYKYSDGKTMYNNVLYVYYNENVICKMFYYRENEISIDYFVKLFDNYKILIEKRG